MTIEQQVTEFHRKFDVPILSHPEIVHNRIDLRWNLIDSEVDELEDALNANDIVEVADALADIIYAAYGMALEFGIPLDDVISEVHRSNMTKSPSPGKMIKGPDYSPPDVESVLFYIPPELRKRKRHAETDRVSPTDQTG